MSSDRIPCCVPFCRRTRRDDGSFSEWICGKHWALVSRKAKLMKRRSEAAYDAAKLECEEISSEGDEFARTQGGGIAVSQEIIDRLRVAAAKHQRKWAQAGRAWDRCKRQAIERSGGI
jgi:hypothetical protein